MQKWLEGRCSLKMGNQWLTQPVVEIGIREYKQNHDAYKKTGTGNITILFVDNHNRN